MAGYMLIEKKMLQPHKADGIVPNASELGFIDYLRELRQEVFPFQRGSKLRLVGFENVLLDAQDRQQIEQLVGKVENVRSIINELGVLGNSTLPQRSSDSLVTGKVKAGLVDAKDLYANAFKIVTERGTTYIMGRVSKREADRATEIARTVVGVQRLVRMLEIISEEELQQLIPKGQPQEQNRGG